MTLEKLIEQMLEFADDILDVTTNDPDGEHLVINTALGNVMIFAGSDGVQDTFAIYKGNRHIKTGNRETISTFLAYKVLSIECD